VQAAWPAHEIEIHFHLWRNLLKKLLIPLAALAVTGVASAQSSVTLFGTVDLGYENVKTNMGRISGLAPSSNSSSKLGFRAVEDLGGGTSAIAWLEAALNASSGIGSSGTNTRNQSPKDVPAGYLTFNRRATVSLAGAWGELRLGRDYTPSYWNYAVYDAFGNNSVGAVLAAYVGDGSAATFVRASNSVGYFLPGNLGGFFGQAMYAFGNRSSIETQNVAAAYGTSPVNTQNNGRHASFRLGWGQGPVNTAISYGRTTYAAGTNPVNMGGFVSTSGTISHMSWGGSYQIAMVKALAQYSRQKADDFGAPGVTRTATGWALGADVGVGPDDILASYSTERIDGFDARGKKFALGYVHNLSKRTAAYATYSHVSNSGGSSFDAGSFSSGGLGAVTGPKNANGSSTGIDIGLRHTF
jgi:predicted porin